MRLAAYQPDIPQNLGALIRVAACFGAPLDVIEPCGFPLSSKEAARAAMDYGALTTITLHPSWDAFLAHETIRAGRLTLLTTRAETPHTDFAFAENDIVLLGRESAGVPEEVHDEVAARIRIALAPGARSLNIAVAAAVALAEARRRLALS